MDIQKSIYKLLKGKEGYHLSDIKIRRDEEKGELVAFISEVKSIGDDRFVGREIDIRDFNHVIRWEGVPKPGGGLRGLARNYLDKKDWERYGLIYQRAEVFEKYLPEERYNEERLLSIQELSELMARINLNYKAKKEKIRERE